MSERVWSETSSITSDLLPLPPLLLQRISRRALPMSMSTHYANTHHTTHNHTQQILLDLAERHLGRSFGSLRPEFASSLDPSLRHSSFVISQSWKTLQQALSKPFIEATARALGSTMSPRRPTLPWRRASTRIVALAWPPLPPSGPPHPIKFFFV